LYSLIGFEHVGHVIPLEVSLLPNMAVVRTSEKGNRQYHSVQNPDKVSRSVKGKVTVALCLTKYYAMKTYPVFN